MSSRYELNAPSVVAETVDGEVMIMNLREGVYYSVVGAGAAIWPALSGGCDVGDIAAAVVAAGAVPLSRARADLEAFVARLVDEAILRAAPSSATAPVPTLGPLRYEGLAIERFDDMRAMLVLDPVHEVGEFGWPQAGGDRPA
jgi:Coenzyme PQQ synthesis protein D (PqqD)